MADSRVSDTVIYEVVAGTPVSLTITVGFTDVGGTAMMLNGIDISTPDGQVVSHELGDGGTLANQFLNCTTTVTHINPAINKTSVTYTLEGGTMPQSFVYPKEDNPVAVDDIVTYTITFIFSAAG